MGDPPMVLPSQRRRHGRVARATREVRHASLSPWLPFLWALPQCRHERHPDRDHRQRRDRAGEPHAGVQTVPRGAGRRAVRQRPRHAGARQPADGHHRDVHRLPAAPREGRRGRGGDRDAQRVPRADRARGHRAGQARAVREADRDEPGRCAGDAEGRGVGGRTAHDRLHLPLRPRDALHGSPGPLRRDRKALSFPPAASRTGGPATSAGGR